MYSEERKKLNRLSRKVPNPCGAKKRLINNRLPGKSSLKGQKHPTNNGIHSSRSTISRHLDFPLEFFKSCAEINAVIPFSGEGISVLQRHLHQITTALVQNAVRNMEQNRRGTPHISDIDSAALAMGMDIPYGAATGELIPVRTGGRNAAPGVGGKMILIRRDKEVDIKTLLRRQPTPVVYDISLVGEFLFFVLFWDFSFPKLVLFFFGSALVGDRRDSADLTAESTTRVSASNDNAFGHSDTEGNLHSSKPYYKNRRHAAVARRRKGW